MQVPPIRITNMVDLYHFMVINFTVFLTFLKLVLLLEGFLFVRVSESTFVSILDNMEVFPLTPRYIALFSVSFFFQGEFIGKTPTDRTQFNFMKRCPYFIASLHTLILLMRRRYLFTVDDCITLAIFTTSLSLHLSLDNKAPSPVKKQEPPKKTSKHEEVDIDFDERASSDFEDEDISESSLLEDEDLSKYSLKKLANKDLNILFSELRSMSEEDQRKLFQCMGGNIDLSNDQELMRKVKFLSQLNKQQEYGQ